MLASTIWYLAGVRAELKDFFFLLVLVFCLVLALNHTKGVAKDVFGPWVCSPWRIALGYVQLAIILKRKCTTLLPSQSLDLASSWLWLQGLIIVKPAGIIQGFEMGLFIFKYIYVIRKWSKGYLTSELRIERIQKPIFIFDKYSKIPFSK